VTIMDDARRRAQRQMNGHHAPAEDEPAEETGYTESTWPGPPNARAYHGLAGDVVRAIEPETEADPVAVLIQFLAAFGSAVGRGPYYRVGGVKHHANAYCVLVGPTAKARKGTSWGWVETILGGVDPEWKRDHVISGLSSREGLIKAFQDMDADKRLLAVEEEFASVLRVMGRDGNTLSVAVRQAWDSGHLRTLTRQDPLRAEDCHMSLVGHITKVELLKCLTETEAANGLANRFLWVCAKRSKLLPDGGDVPHLTGLQERVRFTLNYAGAVSQMHRDRAAKALWHAEYTRLSADRPGLLGLVTNRAEAQVLRLSILYALLDRSDTIGEQHLAAALALWDYCERSAKYVFGESLGDSDADELLDELKRLAARGKGMSRTEINHLFGRHKRAKEIRDILGRLVEAKAVRVEVEETGGRPAERWFWQGGEATPPAN
jgi:hypothetical protein